jgi:hypothetical protein
MLISKKPTDIKAQLRNILFVSMGFQIHVDIIRGGETGIRTLGGVAPSTVFKTVAFNRSAISPYVTVCKRYWFMKQKQEKIDFC